MYIEFKIPGDPMGKQRPKFTHAGKYARTYTPQKTVNYENWVKLCFTQEYQFCAFESRRLKVTIDAYFAIPKSFSKSKKQQAEDSTISPTKKPDCDNIAKVILDALNGIAYEDDKQVTDLTVTKRYSDEPYVVVSIEDY